MGKSETVRVVVSPKSAELTIGLSRADGVPGTIQIGGTLFEAGTINVIRGAQIELWINGLKKATTTTLTTDGGRYLFSYTFGAGSFDIYTRFPGDATYWVDDSPLVVGIYAKIGTELTIDVNPLAGAPPLAVTITGRLYREDTTVGLGGKTVELYRDGALIKSMITKAYTPGLGSYEFHDTLTAGGHEYYTYFRGDTQFEGCENYQGVDVIDGNGEIPNGEPPAADAGLGVLLLALLLVSQE